MFTRVWLVLVLVITVLLGQSFGVIDLPPLDTVSLPPFKQASGLRAQATPTPKAAAPSPALPARRLPAPAATAGLVADRCTPALPRFVGGIAGLEQVLGRVMGEPLECEHAIDAGGNTEQRTTTGLAYYRAASNIAAFTTGWDHWALTSRGVVHWTGEPLEPPPGAAAVPHAAAATKSAGMLTRAHVPS